MPAKIRFSVQKNAHFGGFVGFFYHFMSQKSRFLHFFKVFFELLRECLGIFFFTQKANFWFYFQLKRLIHDHENWDFWSDMTILAVLKGRFDHFWVTKSCFLHFFKVVQEFFRKCFGILLRLNRPISWSISQQRWSPKFTLSFGVPYLTSATLPQDFLFLKFQWNLLLFSKSWNFRTLVSTALRSR